MEQQQHQELEKKQELGPASALYKPRLREESSILEVDAMSIDQCETIREMDDSQLVGAPAAANAGVTDMPGRGGGCLVDVEIKLKQERETAPGVAETITGKRRRGRPPRGHPKTTPPPAPPPRKKKDEEDVCFICFDGGTLVLCDRRGCPKAYHPACIKRDDAFFRSKAKWNCGWHICSSCQKACHYMCYTCTYSVCKACVKDADYLGVRGNKGFCGTCMKTIMLIENAGQKDNETVQVDFDDTGSWEYLFKVYWLYLKGKLSLTLEELAKAINPWKGTGILAPTMQSFSEPCGHNDDRGSCSDNTCEDLIANHDKRRKTQTLAIPNKMDSLSAENSGGDKRMGFPEDTKWATSELLDFVAHVNNGNTSVLSKYDVQNLFLEYVKINNLRDPNQKCQIICDARLVRLFGKERVGHFEMLKLIENHVLIPENSPAANTGEVGVTEAVPCQVEADGNNYIPVMGNDRKRKMRKRVDERGPHANPDDYAAVDVHNINLIYLRRTLMENLTDDAKKFHEKVVGSIVRIRISGSDQKQDIYRLVQVVGTSKVAEPYKIGSRTTDSMLEILNLDKKEVISIDGISNQEFSEDECRRLRQSIKCGLIKRLTVGEIREKAVALQAVKVNDWLEAEILRLNHLRDRANEKGLRKELRECVEKLELLNSPEERERRLLDIPEVHCDLNMDPSYESEDELDGKKGNHMRARASDFSKKENKPVSPRRGGDVLNDKGNREQNNLAGAVGQSKTIFSVGKDCPIEVHERVNDSACNQGTEFLGLNDLNAPKIQVGPTASGQINQAVVRPDTSAIMSGELLYSTGMDQPIDAKETNKTWLYQDPTGKIHGPFALFQLRKWNTTGHFPPDLRIWKMDEKHGNSILLAEALNGQCLQELKLLRDKCLAPLELTGASLDRGINLDSGLSGNMNAPVHSEKVELSWNSGCNDASAISNSSNEFARNSTPNDTSANSSTCTVTADVAANSKGRQTISFLLGLDSLKDDNSLPGQPKVTSSHPPAILSGNPCVTLSLEVREDSGVENQNTGKSRTDGGSCKKKEDKKQGDSEGNSSQSCGQNWKGPPVSSSSNFWDSNSGFASLAKSLETSKKNQEIGFPDLPSPTPKSSLEDLEGQATEVKQSVSSSVLVQDSGISWSTASSLVGGGTHIREVAGEWSTYSSTPAKPSVEEWDPSLVAALSLKPPKVAVEHVATTSGCPQVTHPSPPHPASNASDWPTIMTEANECDESVSDLLAEVEAMESLNGLPSPTSILRELTQGSDDDCFSPVEGLSPAPDLGKNDALSSTNDFQMPSQSNGKDEPLVLSHINFLDRQKVSGGLSITNSEVEEDKKPIDLSINQCEAGSSDIPPPAPPVTSWDVTPSVSSAWSAGSEPTGVSWSAVQGNPNLSWAALVQATTTMSWEAGQGTATQENASISSGNTTGNPAPWGSQPRYGSDRSSGSRDRDFLGRDSSFGKGRSLWNNRQSLYGAQGMGSFSKPPPKGQRVCKFYENGYCKRGASCSYWHP